MTIQGPRTDEAGPTVDASGAPIEDAGLDAEDAEGTRPAEGRVLDRGAVYAAVVGLGMAVTIALSFELVLAVQALVFIAAPLAGAVIGYYANHKSERWRPRWRLFGNAAFAGAITGLSLALMYVALRLLFIYADSGFRNEAIGGQIDCATGPECTYQRFIAEGFEEDLLADGIIDAASFEAAIWAWQRDSALVLILLTLGGSLVAATWRAVRPPPDPRAQHAAVTT